MMLTAVLGYNPRHQQGAPSQLLVRFSDSLLVSRRMTSRDAYMLVYMRRGAAPGEAANIHQPPQRALDVVLQMNQSHANACATFAARSVA